MSIGTIGRQLLGRYEPAASKAVKAVFLDTNVLARRIAATGAAGRILEIGCGDGTLAEAVMSWLPTKSTLLGIDIAPGPGRLFAGDRSRATFRQVTVADLAAEQPERFDVVALVDVLHHVPDAEITDLLGHIHHLLTDDGLLIVVEWERRRTLGYWAGWFQDRVVSGQRVRYFTETELRALLEAQFPALTLHRRARIGPLRSNLLLAWRRPRETPTSPLLA